jgi:hypothetical protein
MTDIIMDSEKKYLVAFLDIPGFKSIIKDFFDGTSSTAYETLNNALDDAKRFGLEISQNTLKEDNFDMSYKIFSDCVSISMALKEGERASELLSYIGFINTIRTYQIILLSNGILIRGGISIGKHIESSNMIFSEALVKSYKIESQKSIYPRILLDKEILVNIENIIKQDDELNNVLNTLSSNSFVSDWDDEVFISPFGLSTQFKNFVLADEEYREKVIDLFDKLNDDKIPYKIDNEKLFEFTSLHNEENDIKEILNLVKKRIEEYQNKEYDILLKYKWLEQFIRWILNPEDSAIRFRYYFKREN